MVMAGHRDPDILPRRIRLFFGDTGIQVSRVEFFLAFGYIQLNSRQDVLYVERFTGTEKQNLIQLRLTDNGAAAVHILQQSFQICPLFAGLCPFR